MTGGQFLIWLVVAVFVGAAFWFVASNCFRDGYNDGFEDGWKKRATQSGNPESRFEHEREASRMERSSK